MSLNRRARVCLPSVLQAGHARCDRSIVNKHLDMAYYILFWEGPMNRVC